MSTWSERMHFVRGADVNDGICRAILFELAMAVPKENRNDECVIAAKRLAAKVPISETQLFWHLDHLEAAGLVLRKKRHQSSQQHHPGARAPNLYRLSTSTVRSSGSQPRNPQLASDQAERDTNQTPESGPRHAPTASGLASSQPRNPQLASDQGKRDTNQTPESGARLPVFTDVSTTTPAAAPARHTLGGGGGDHVDTQARDFVAGLPWKRRPGQARKQQLADQVAAACSAGWSLSDLRSHVAGNFDGSCNPDGLMVSRLCDLPDVDTATMPPVISPACRDCLAEYPGAATNVNLRYRIDSITGKRVMCECHPAWTGTP